MFCSTPTFSEEPSFTKVENVEGFLRLPFGFIFDTVNYTEMQGGMDENHMFQLFPNPHFEPFKEKVMNYKSDYLTINVSYFLTMINLLHTKVVYLFVFLHIIFSGYQFKLCIRYVGDCGVDWKQCL
jgi:hypothetical protein